MRMVEHHNHIFSDKKYHTCFSKEKEKQDNNGYFEIQFWEFMKIFGEFALIGGNLASYLSLDILFESKDLKPFIQPQNG